MPQDKKKPEKKPAEKRPAKKKGPKQQMNHGGDMEPVTDDEAKAQKAKRKY
jgi:hypothetical protein